MDGHPNIFSGGCLHILNNLEKKFLSLFKSILQYCCFYATLDNHLNDIGCMVNFVDPKQGGNNLNLHSLQLSFSFTLKVPL